MRALTLMTLVICCGGLGTSRTRAQPATDPAPAAVPEPAPVRMPAPLDTEPAPVPMPAPVDANAPTAAAAHAAAEALITSAQDHYRNGAYSEARRDAEAALLLQPDDHGTLRLVGRVRLMAGDLSGAIDALRLAIAQSPHDAELRVWLGDAQRSSGDAQAARQSYARALVIDPGNLRAQDGLRLARHAPVRAVQVAAAPGPVREESAASPSPMRRVFSQFNATGAAVGAVAGLVLAVATADWSGGDSSVFTGLLTVGAGTLSGGALGGGIAAPRGADWKPWLALGSGATIAGIGLYTGDRALSRAQRGDESARDIALNADILLATGLVVIGSAVGIAIGRKPKDDERDAAVLSVAPVVGPSAGGIHALGRF